MKEQQYYQTTLFLFFVFVIVISSFYISADLDGANFVITAVPHCECNSSIQRQHSVQTKETTKIDDDIAKGGWIPGKVNLFVFSN